MDVADHSTGCAGFVACAMARCLFRLPLVAAASKGSVTVENTATFQPAGCGYDSLGEQK